jgi:nucleotide-binding universal stress UspA family protein
MLAVQRILCGVDFSDCSRHAFDRAVAVARADRAALTVLHVLEREAVAPVAPYVGPEGLAPFVSQFDPERIKCEMERYLEIDRVRGVNVDCVAVEAMHVDDEILAQARTLAADLIVMGTHGRSGFQRLVLGSIAERVLRKAEPAVLTVPPSSVEHVSSRQAPFQRILCAIDFSDWSLGGLRYAVSLAQRHDARLGVCHVIDLIAPIYDPVVGPLYDPLASAPVEANYLTAAEIVTRERLRSLLTPAVRGTIAVDELVARGKAHQELVRLAGSWRSDVIVMGTHGRRMIDRALFGATVERVVRHAPCPVLTVRSDVRATQREGSCESVTVGAIHAPLVFNP